MTDKAVRKYIERYAEPEVCAGVALGDAGRRYAAIVTLPACGEGDSLFAALDSVPLCAAGPVLIVVIVNESEGAAPSVLEANRIAIARLADGTTDTAMSHVRIGQYGEHDLVLIERTETTALPPGQGVGLARKIAADFAIGLWSRAGLDSHWIHCTDADALLPGDYFDRPRGETAALTFDFRHEGSAAVLEYEAYLRYSVLGLHAAGSPWAWHAIGSTLALDARAYTRVRGFPRREAAEDFHLLAKLSKLAAVAPLRGEPIRLDDRPSARVPFGTGLAMRRARERSRTGQPLLVPDPRVYAGLASWQRALGMLARDPERPVSDAIDRACAGSVVAGADLRAALAATGALQSAEKILAKQKDPGRFLHENFDALASLRLLHELRDRRFPAFPLARAIAEADFLDEAVRAAGNDLEAVREALLNQERRSLR